MDRRTDGQTLFYRTLPAKAGGQKKPFSDQVFTTFNDLPKAIRIIDNKKKYFTENQKNI